MTINFAQQGIEEPKRLSFSSVNTYAECGEKWRLERGYGLNSSTWFATVAGSTVHHITECIDRGEPVPTFQEEFDRRLAVETGNGVEVKPSGKVLVKVGPNGGPNKKDYAWWLVYGPLYVQAWVDWKAETSWTLMEIDGKPAVEVEIDADLGGEANKGFIDRVFITPDGQVVVVDLKCGEPPKGNLQLGNYRVGLKRQYGIEADLGAFWMASKGDVAGLVDLTIYSTSYIDSLYEQAWRGIRAGVFLPNIGSFCRGCGVRDACRAVGGRDAILYPIRTDVIPQHVSGAQSPDSV